jgi:O-antigen ligase
LWAIWQTVVRKDFAVGLALYLGLVIIADTYLLAGIFLPGMEKGSIRFSEVCAAFLLMSRPGKPLQRLSRSLIIFLMAAYFTLLLASVFRSDYLLTGLVEFRRWMIPQVIAFIVASRGLDSPQAYRRFFLCMTALFVIIGIFTFWDLFFNRVILKSEMLDHGIYWFNRGKNRFGSFFLNPNYLGAFVVLVFPPAFVWTTLERRHRLYAWVGVLALIFSLVETQSRGAMLAFGVGMLGLVFGPCGELSRTRRVGFLALGALVLFLLMPGAYGKAVKRFDNIDTESEAGRSRRTTWEYTLRMIGDHPVAGIGFGEKQFMKFMTEYGFEGEYGKESLDAPHNSYLQAGVYAGLPALAAFLFANMLLLGKALARSLGGTSDAEGATVFGLSVGILGFLACVFTDLQLFTPHVGSTYFVFVGLLLSIVTKPKDAEASLPVWAAQPTSAFFTPNPVGARPVRAKVRA